RIRRNTTSLGFCPRRFVHPFRLSDSFPNGRATLHAPKLFCSIWRHQKQKHYSKRVGTERCKSLDSGVSSGTARKEVASRLPTGRLRTNSSASRSCVLPHQLATGEAQSPELRLVAKSAWRLSHR